MVRMAEWPRPEVPEVVRYVICEVLKFSELTTGDKDDFSREVGDICVRIKAVETDHDDGSKGVVLLEGSSVCKCCIIAVEIFYFQSDKAPFLYI